MQRNFTIFLFFLSIFSSFLKKALYLQRLLVVVCHSNDDVFATAKAQPHEATPSCTPSGRLEGCNGWVGNETSRHKRRLLSAWFETLCNLANHNCCLGLSNGRCPRDVFMRIPFTYSINIRRVLGGVIFISAWALTLSVQ